MMGKFYKVDGKVEQDLRSMGDCLRDQGYTVESIRSYKTRLREFACWFKESHGENVVPEQVTKEVILEYREHLEMTKDSSGKVVTGLVPLRAYNRWAVETGRLGKTHLIPKGSRLTEKKPSVKVVEQEKVFIYGWAEFLVWLGDRGLNDRTIEVYRSVLRCFARWLKTENEVGLTPENATPENLDRYRKASGRSKTTQIHWRAPIHWYVRWGLEKGYLEADLFGRRYSGTKGSTLIRSGEKEEFAEWLRSNGIVQNQINNRLSALRQFGRWYFLSRGSRISRYKVTEKDIGDYKRYLWQSYKPPSMRRLFSGSTITRYVSVARSYLKWARHKVDEP